MQTWVKLECFLLALAAVVGAGQSAQASVLAHTGTVVSTPPGTGDVDVTFLKGTTTPGQDYLLAGEVFNASVGHTIFNDFGVATAAESADRALEGIVNNTTDSWSAFIIQLIGADFSGLGSGQQTPADNPVVVGGDFGDAFIHMSPLSGTFGVGSSSITRTDANSTLAILFDSPVLPGNSFSLGFDFFGSGISFNPEAATYQAAIFQVPIVADVPEPASCMLLAGGLTLLAGRRTRRCR